eukprot:3256942-Prymnesium_polylepis.1
MAWVGSRYARYDIVSSSSESRLVLVSIIAREARRGSADPIAFAERRVTRYQGNTPLSGGKGVGSSGACTWYERYY